MMHNNNKNNNNKNHDKDKDKENDDDTNEQPIIDIANNTSSSELKMSWVDHVTGISFRAARSLLQYIALLTVVSTSSEGESDEITTKMAEMTENSEEKEKEVPISIVQTIIQAIGTTYASKMFRGHFFGRFDLQSWMDEKEKKEHERKKASSRNKTNADTIQFNGMYSSVQQQQQRQQQQKELQQDNFHDRITKYKSSSASFMVEDKEGQQPHVKMPARVASSLRLLGAIQESQLYSSSLSSSSDIWDCLLPVVYTLIDSITPSYQSLGGALLLNLLEKWNVTNRIKKQQHLYMHNITQILSMSCKVCNDAYALSILHRARVRIFEWSGNNDNRDVVNKLRREAANDTFTWIQKNSYHGPGEKPRHWIE